MSLNSIMNIAVSGMRTSQAQLRVTSDNIANVNTVGYVRKTADQTSVVTGGVGAGVDVARVRLVTDRFLQAASLSANADAARQSVRYELFDQIQSKFGDPSSNTGFFSDIDALFASYGTLAETTTSSAARQDTVFKTQQLFGQASTIASQIQQVRQEADGRLQASIETINPLLAQIDKLNKTISAGTAVNADVTGSQNAQQSLIDQLAKYMDIKVEQRVNGGVQIRTANGTSLIGEGHASLSYQAAGTVDAGTVFSDVMITEPSGTRSSFLDGLTSGELRGLIELRDKDAPAAAARLGELTGKLADELNRAHNANSAVPAPNSLTGRNIGQSLETALAGFDGNTVFAVTNADGTVQRQVTVNFSAAGFSVNGGPVAPMADFVAGVNAALAPDGQVSFNNGSLGFSANDANRGVVIANGTPPAEKGGRGFSHWFGMNDLVVSNTPSFYETGLSLSSQHGFAADQSITFRFAGATGARERDINVVLPAGGTMTDMLASLNDPVSGVGRYGAFSLSVAGILSFKPHQGASMTMSVVKDMTQQNPSGLSMSELFGLGGVPASRATGYTVRSDISRNPGQLALSQYDSTAVAGGIALSKSDGRGALALADAGRTQVNFAAAGGNAGGLRTLSSYAADFAGDIGGRAAAAKNASETAQAMSYEAANRRTSYEGVNMDEELVNMTTFQQAFNASARLIQASKDMYDTLLGMI